MNKITLPILEKIVDRINRTLKTPMATYTRIGEKLVPNAGNYHLDSAYGGYSLHQMGAGGGTSDVFRCGHISKPALADKMHAFLDGVEVATKTI